MQQAKSFGTAAPRSERIIIRTRRGRLARYLLPTRLEEAESRRDDARILLTFGLQRSGQHAVITWLGHCCGDALHRNHCRFVRRGLRYELAPWERDAVFRNGRRYDDREGAPEAFAAAHGADRFGAAIYSLEDPDLTETQIRRVASRPRTTCILILRDPFNWLASVMKRGTGNAKRHAIRCALYKQHLRHALGLENAVGCDWVVVDFGRFVTSVDYRQALARSLGLEVAAAAERSLERIESYGGGSSFSGTAREDDHARAVLRRWEHFVDDPTYHSLLGDEEIRALARRFFSDLPHLAEAERALGPRTDGS
jgi:hypothetical protein